MQDVRQGVARHLRDDQEAPADRARSLLQGVRHPVRCLQGAFLSVYAYLNFLMN